MKEIERVKTLDPPKVDFIMAYTAFLNGKSIRSVVNPITLRLSEDRKTFFVKNTIGSEHQLSSLKERYISFEMMFNDWQILD